MFSFILVSRYCNRRKGPRANKFNIVWQLGTHGVEMSIEWLSQVFKLAPKTCLVKIESTPGLKFLWFHTTNIYDFILSMLDFLVDPCRKPKSYMIFVWLYQEIIYDPSTNIKNHTYVFRNSVTIYVFFCFCSLGHQLYDTPASDCDPPKDPTVHCHLQSWALNNRVSPNR